MAQGHRQVRTVAQDFYGARQLRRDQLQIEGKAALGKTGEISPPVRVIQQGPGASHRVFGFRAADDLSNAAQVGVDPLGVQLRLGILSRKITKRHDRVGQAAGLVGGGLQPPGFAQRVIRRRADLDMYGLGDRQLTDI